MSDPLSYWSIGLYVVLGILGISFLYFAFCFVAPYFSVLRSFLKTPKTILPSSNEKAKFDNLSELVGDSNQTETSSAEASDAAAELSAMEAKTEQQETTAATSSENPTGSTQADLDTKGSLGSDVDKSSSTDTIGSLGSDASENASIDTEGSIGADAAEASSADMKGSLGSDATENPSADTIGELGSDASLDSGGIESQIEEEDSPSGTHVKKSGIAMDQMDIDSFFKPKPQEISDDISVEELQKMGLSEEDIEEVKRERDNRQQHSPS